MQGRSTDTANTERICNLLRTSTLTMQTIAKRMGVSQGVIVDVNRDFNIRDYKGFKTKWMVAGVWKENPKEY